ncbi:hypothetical protein Droror1_Dr00001041 [Drosera rotundifolia]
MEVDLDSNLVQIGLELWLCYCLLAVTYEIASETCCLPWCCLLCDCYVVLAVCRAAACCAACRAAAVLPAMLLLAACRAPARYVVLCLLPSVLLLAMIVLIPRILDGDWGGDGDRFEIRGSETGILLPGPEPDRCPSLAGDGQIHQQALKSLEWS